VEHNKKTVEQYDEDGGGMIRNLLYTNVGYFDQFPVGTTYTESLLDLGFCILQLAYFSTDTIERGATLYQIALRQFYHSFRLDPFNRGGALEGALMLMAALGYDDMVVSITKFFTEELHKSNGSVNNVLQETMNSTKDLDALWIWPEIHAAESVFDPSDVRSDYALFYLCMMLVKMRLLVRHRLDQRKLSSFRETTLGELVPVQLIVTECMVGGGDHLEERLKAEIQTIVNATKEHADWILESIPPDAPMLTKDHLANVGFGNNDLGEMNQTSRYDFHMLWMILKDCFALTPGLMDVFLEFTTDD
jgi:hypothetical protein